MAEPRSDPRDALLNLAAGGRFEEARPGLLRLLTRNPGDHEARLALAEAFFQAGQTATAQFHAAQIVNGSGARDDVLAAACDLLSRVGKLGLAMQALETRRRADPQSLVVRLAAAFLHLAAAQLDEATILVREAEVLAPDTPAVLRLKAALEARRGEIEEAVETYRRYLWAVPDDIGVWSEMAYTLNSSLRSDRKSVLEAHCRFGQLLADATGNTGFRLPPLDPQRRPLRVGLLTHDAMVHSMASFLEGPLRGLNRSDFQVWLYHTRPLKDAVTQHLAAMADGFVHAPGLTAPVLAQRIHDDKIDVLIELSGHMIGNRLHTMQLRPAPLQMTYLGYPDTTGLRAIDCRVVDGITDPPGAEAFAAERLVRIDPCFLCFTPPWRAPERLGAGWKPPARATRDGEPVFCCFNGAIKMNDFSIGLWARVLQAVPGSRLLIKSRGVSGPFSGEGLRGRFARAGLDPDRLDIIPPVAAQADHLALYGRTDIQLDTFPYTGTTTTCESLACGVPVVTLAGDRHVSRVSASIMHAVGLPELVATSAEDFVGIAGALATDTARLRALQAGLPGRVEGSVLCDVEAFGRRLGGAILSAWREKASRGVTA